MRTKTAVGIALFISWAFIVALFVAVLISNENKVQMNLQGNSDRNLNIPATSKFTPDNVASHDSHDNCWVIVNEKIYDLTDFLNRHSGGANSISKYCGKDGTNAFKTKDRDPPVAHKSGNIDILEKYYVGDLE